MQHILLNERTARVLRSNLTDLLDSNTTGFELTSVSIRSGDPSGCPEGWDSCEVVPLFKTKTLGSVGGRPAR